MFTVSFSISYLYHLFFSLSCILSVLFFSFIFKIISSSLALAILCFFLNPPSFHFTLQNLFLTFHPGHLNNACFQIPWTLLLSAVLNDSSHLFHLLTFSGRVDVSVDLLSRGRCYCVFLNFLVPWGKREHTGLPGVWDASMSLCIFALVRIPTGCPGRWRSP